jgi:hypothetical protein
LAGRYATEHYNNELATRNPRQHLQLPSGWVRNGNAIYLGIGARLCTARWVEPERQYWGYFRSTNNGWINGRDLIISGLCGTECYFGTFDSGYQRAITAAAT